MKVAPKLFSAILGQLGSEEKVLVQGSMAWLPEHEVVFTSGQQRVVDELMARFASKPFSPPTIKESVAAVGEDLYQTLVAMGKLLPVSQEVVFRTEDYQQAIADVSDLAAQHGTFTLAQARDHWGTTRRFVQDLLEYMDREGITLRVGDGRKLRSK
jgi:selenocysteine-specific elongation factor